MHQGVTGMINNKFMKNKFNAVSPAIKETKVKATPQNKAIDYKEPPTIQCTCGAKILIVPDITAMNLAIKKHKAEHEGANEGFLVEQIIETIAKRKTQ